LAADAAHAEAAAAQGTATSALGTANTARIEAAAAQATATGAAADAGTALAQNSAQDGRITAAEDVNAAHGTQIAAIQSVNATQDSRLTSLETMTLSAIPALQALTATHSAQIDDLYAITDRDRREAQRGTAVAVALTAAPMPSEPGKTSYTFNLATFRGEQAVGASIAHRFDTGAPLALTAGVSHAAGRNTTVRVGVAGEF
jgi:hypothetical protein